jgi:phospholipid/cholesterol/gamma-HCH transport system ATP-binding protein
MLLLLKLKILYKSFGDLHVLRGVDLNGPKRGENVVVLGRSGTGKSVLIKIIAGLLLKQDKGKCEVLGQKFLQR